MIWLLVLFVHSTQPWHMTITDYPGDQEAACWRAAAALTGDVTEGRCIKQEEKESNYETTHQT